MPGTNYGGDPTAAQAPGVAPYHGATPLLNIPVDGDAANAASIAQAFKALADYIAFLQSRFSNPSVWVQKLEVYQDAQQRPRFTVDHWGLPKCKKLSWEEGWGASLGSFTKGGASSSFAGPDGKWAYVGNGTNCGSASYPAGVNPGFNYLNTSRSLWLRVDGGVATNHTEMRLADTVATAVCHDDSLVILRAHVTPVSVSNVNWVFGFTAVSENVNNVQHGAFVILQASSTYRCRTINGGSFTEVDSGVSGTAGNSHDWEIHVVGANVDDASTARVLFFVEGTLVANITGTIPAGSQLIPIFGGVTTGTVADPVMVVGPVEYTQITRTLGTL